MDLTEFSTILFFGSFVAGLIGATSGLGGGIVLMPLMALFFKVDILYAIGASLIGVIATSIGASVHFLKKDLVDIRVTSFLETATVPGAFLGAFFATIVHEGFILVLFGMILIFSVFQSKMADSNETKNQDYPKNKFGGWITMLFAGIFSGLLGIGSGAFKVISMDRIMHIPFRISTATSSFMIGVTASASASTFYYLGYISPMIVMSLVPGVLLGSFVGSKLVTSMDLKILRKVFSFVILILSFELIVQGIGRIIG